MPRSDSRKEVQIDFLMKAVDTLRARERDLKARLDSDHEAFQVLQARLEETAALAEQVPYLKKMLADVEVELEEERRLRGCLQNEFEDMKAKKIQWQRLVRGSSERISELEDQLWSSEAVLQDVLQEVEDLKMELDEERRLRGRLENELAQKDGGFCDLEDQLWCSEAVIEDLLQEVEDLKIDLDEAATKDGLQEIEYLKIELEEERRWRGCLEDELAQNDDGLKTACRCDKKADQNPPRLSSASTQAPPPDEEEIRSVADKLHDISEEEQLLHPNGMYLPDDLWSILLEFLPVAEVVNEETCAVSRFFSNSKIWLAHLLKLMDLDSLPQSTGKKTHPAIEFGSWSCASRQCRPC
eukprot:Skav222584  [mRNA]  locus=scaffold1897:239947:241011:- [translate_table: standard]